MIAANRPKPHKFPVETAPAGEFGELVFLSEMPLGAWMAGTLEHLYDAIIEGSADAVLMALIAHFEDYTITQMKEYLRTRGIPGNL